MTVMHSPDEPDDEVTVVMRRDANSEEVDDDRTVAIDRDQVEDDVTVVVERGSAEDDATVLMQRGAVDDDATLARDRPPVGADATVARPRGDDTVIILRDGDAPGPVVRADGASVADAAVPPARARPAMTPQRKRRRGELHPAPVPAGYGERAIRATGAGAVSTYRTRSIPRPPDAGGQLAPTATVRRVTGGIHSVARRSRRFAAVALVGFAASCLIAVVGLALIARAAFGP